MADNKLKAQVLVDKGANAHQIGQLKKAENFYKRALKIENNNADAMHLLGLLTHQKGRHEYAAKLIKKALIIKPNEPNYNTNLAIIYNKLSRWDESEKVCRIAIESAPKHAEAYNNLGRALSAQNKFIDAEAAYAKAIEYAPQDASAGNNLGYLYMQQGLLALAEKAFLEAIKVDGAFLLAYSNLATTYLAMGLLDKAEEICRAAISKEPNFIPAIHSLGVVLTRLNKSDSAEKFFKQVLDFDPYHSQAVLNLASLYSVQGKVDLAKKLFEKAIKLEPTNSEAHVNMGIFYSELGQLGEAVIYLNKALELDPDNIEAYYILSTSGRVVLELEVLNRLEMKLDSKSGITPDQRTKIYFILAMQLERSGNVSRSFYFYDIGNQFRQQLFDESGNSFDHDLHCKELQRYKRTFSEGFFIKWAELEEVSSPEVPSPIFIVGMPRSGTTLIEQIIASHPEVSAGGELSIIGRFVDDFVTATGGRDNFPASISNLDLKQITKWKSIFSAKLRKLTSSECYVIDKTPFNFNNLWLIQLMYPNSKIIHCTRDFRDVGLSCYQQNFVEKYAWSCNLTQIGHYINAYSDLMAFWKKVLNLPILDVRYENFVLDAESSSRKILDFLKLEWRGGILDFYNNDIQVRTASKWQVRLPVYRHSVDRWKKFENELAPLINTLKIF